MRETYIFHTSFYFDILFLSVHSSDKHLHQRTAKHKSMLLIQMNVQWRISASLRCETTEHPISAFMPHQQMFVWQRNAEGVQVAGLGHLKTSNQVSSVNSEMKRKLLTQALKRHILIWPDMSAEKYSQD